VEQKQLAATHQSFTLSTMILAERAAAMRKSLHAATQ
jgi:hypothetical protein